MWKALSSKNTCKTCALGMGGQFGGMRNEQGHWPEVCKKSIQALAADMQGTIQPEFFNRFSISALLVIVISLLSIPLVNFLISIFFACLIAF